MPGGFPPGSLPGGSRGPKGVGSMLKFLSQGFAAYFAALALSFWALLSAAALSAFLSLFGLS